MDFLKVLFFFALFFSLLQSRRPRLPKENHSPQPNQHNSSSPSPPPLSFTFVEPPNPRVNISEGSSLFYLHIAKTGGHTVNSVLSRVQNPSPYSPNEPGYFKKVCKDQEKMKHTLVFSKEIEFQAVAAQLKNIPTEEVVVQNKTVNRTECFSQRFLFFSVLRDPVTWLDSAWSHACSSPVRYNDANFTAICRSGNVTAAHLSKMHRYFIHFPWQTPFLTGIEEKGYSFLYCRLSCLTDCLRLLKKLLGDDVIAREPTQTLKNKRRRTLYSFTFNETGHWLGKYYKNDVHYYESKFKGNCIRTNLPEEQLRNLLPL